MARTLGSGGVFLAGLGSIILFFYLDRHNDISLAIERWGVWGIVASIALMTLLSTVPVPSEFLLMLNMKVYGVWRGVLFAWTGTMIGSLLVFAIARYLGRPVLMRFVREERFHQVETWVQRNHTVGLLIARMLPVPGFVVNYAAGMMRPVRLWTYLWTGAVTIIPYYVGTALLYLGVIKRLIVWLAAGGTALLLAWAISVAINRRVKRKADGKIKE